MNRMEYFARNYLRDNEATWGEMDEWWEEDPRVRRAFIAGAKRMAEELEAMGVHSAYVAQSFLDEAIEPDEMIFIVEPDENTSFIRADQGIFVPNGQSMNSVMVHGILHGNSQFTGALNRLSVSYLVGSVTVAGDLGSLTTQTDAGAFAIEPDFDFSRPVTVDPIYRTEGAIVVGRTVGAIAIGARGH